MKKSFTLIELLVVVAIIGILFSLLLPSLRTARIKSMMAVCLSNQGQVFKGLQFEMDDRNGNEVLTFNDGSNDGPDEGPTDYNQRKQHKDLTIMTKGNPAVNLEIYLDSRVFFCPVGSYNNDDNYNIDPRSTVSKDDAWEEYQYLYGKVLRGEETNGRVNNILNVNDESRNIVLIDADVSYMKDENKFTGWSTLYEHYSAGFSDGSAKYITNEPLTRNIYLWGNSDWGG
jgi:prepilin-type N-terminal cleavage/methylation domain-containing protein